MLNNRISKPISYKIYYNQSDGNSYQAEEAELVWVDVSLTKPPKVKYQIDFVILEKIALVGLDFSVRKVACLVD